MNALSDLVRLIRLNVTIYHNAKVCGNWHLKAHGLGQPCFHIVTVGACRIDVPGHLSTVLNVGDLILFPGELPHTMNPEEAAEGEQRHLPYSEAEDIPGTGLLCAEVSFQHKASEQVLKALPPLVLIRNDDRHPWLQPMLDMIVYESHAATSMSSIILERLSELLFTYALSDHLKVAPDHISFLALHTHPRLSAVVNAIHQNPGEHWSLETMAQHAAQSRTLFCRTFKQVSGWTPMQYLTWWRMQLAWSLLESGKSVAEVAEEAGYDSVGAFSRAFLKCFGINAGRVRRGQHNTQSASSM